MALSNILRIVVLDCDFYMQDNAFLKNPSIKAADKNLQKIKQNSTKLLVYKEETNKKQIQI